MIQFEKDETVWLKAEVTQVLGDGWYEVAYRSPVDGLEETSTDDLNPEDTVIEKLTTKIHKNQMGKYINPI